MAGKPPAKPPGSPAGSDRGGEGKGRHKWRGHGSVGHDARPVVGLYDKGADQKGPNDDDGEEDVDFDKEMRDVAEIENVEEEEYKRRRAMLAERQGHVDPKLWKRFALPDDPSEFSREHTELEIDHILRAPTSMRDNRQDGTLWWSTESDECKEFRVLMHQSTEKDERDFERRHRMSAEEGKRVARDVLPRYLGPRLDPARRSRFPLQIQMHVVWPRGEGLKWEKEFQFDNRTKADVALAQVMRELLDSNQHPASAEVAAEQYVFKRKGRADYIWGPDNELIDFIYIREQLQCKLPAELVLHKAGFKREDEHKQIHYRYAVPACISHRHQSVYASPGSRHSERRKSRSVHMLKDMSPMSVESNDVHMLKELSLWEIKTFTELTIRNITSMRFSHEMMKEYKLQGHEDREEDIYVCVVGQLFHGGRELTKVSGTPWRKVRDPIPSSSTKPCPPSYHNAVWGKSAGTLRFDIRMCNLPREVRLCLSIVACLGDALERVTEAVKQAGFGILLTDEAVQGQKSRMSRLLQLGVRDDEDKGLPIFYLGWVNYQLFDHRGLWRGGERCLRMWPVNQRANPIGVVSMNNDSGAMAATIKMTQFACPVRFPCGMVPDSMRRELEQEHFQGMKELDGEFHDSVVNQIRKVRQVVQSDSLYNMKPVDKLLLWQFRKDLTNNFRALPKFLQSVNWDKPAAVQEAVNMLHATDAASRWRMPNPGEELIALELLDARYASSVVREYALDILDKLGNAELADCILQLVQVLKYEPYHYSALSRFLLKRSLQNPHQIGHYVFWHLNAEMYNPMVSERHGLLIEEYLKRSPQRRCLVKQAVVTQQLLKVALKIKEGPKQGRLEKAQHELRQLKLPAMFALPLDPRFECTGVMIEKCKVMDSKKLPLWCVMTNADPMGSPIFIIFKAGDDLRQDLLTLQMISMMDSCWKAEGLDLRMSPYGCIATDDGVGYIEVVMDSETIAEVTKKSGGAAAAWTQDPMLNWLRQQKCNKSDNDAEYVRRVEKCMWNFLHSTAGYCVATYILGIGDRHNDNIMIKRNGTLFHIDFGHFLGNFKTKFGFKRETAPFIFTPMYAHVLGGEKSPVYRHFVHIAGTAYNIVRRNAHIIIALFALMLSTGIPELQKPEDIEWLQGVLLMQDTSDDEGELHFSRMIKESLGNYRAQLNDFIHIKMHP